MRQKNKTAQGERHKKSAPACNFCHGTRNPVVSPHICLQQSDLICASTQHVILAPRIPSAPSHMLKTNHCAAHMTETAPKASLVRVHACEKALRQCPHMRTDSMPGATSGRACDRDSLGTLAGTTQGQPCYKSTNGAGTLQHVLRMHAGSLGLEQIAAARQQK